MFSYLLSMMMMISPMAAGGNGHHWGWRNQAPRDVPPVTVVVPRPSSPSAGPGNLAPGTDPNPGPRKYGEE